MPIIHRIAVLLVLICCQSVLSANPLIEGKSCKEPRDWSWKGELSESPTCVNTPAGPVIKDTTGCYKGTDKYNNKIIALAQSAFRDGYKGTVGCLTYPYLGDLYDISKGREEEYIKNTFHAGIDLRGVDESGKEMEVYAVASGTVVKRSYYPESNPQHSTLIIESEDPKIKILYLHMRYITKQVDIKKGDLIGIASDVGAQTKHLHIEVWPSGSELYNRSSAIWGCGDKKCTDTDIEKYTMDPSINQILVNQSQEKPNIPYEDWGACPFELCTYKEWTAEASIPVRKDRKFSSPVIFKIKKNEKIRAIRGVVVTKKPGIVRILKPFKDVYSYQRYNYDIQPIFARGDILYTLHYGGEGYNLYWYKGDLYWGDGIAELNKNSKEWKSRTMDVLSWYKTEWWVYVVNSAGKSGWTLGTYKFRGQYEFD